MEVETNFAPLNTKIDADRDYRDLTGLSQCGCGCEGPCRCGAGLSGCGCGGYRPRIIPPGVHGLSAAEEKGGLSTAMVISLLLLFSAFVTIKPGEPAFRDRYEP